MKKNSIQRVLKLLGVFCGIGIVAAEVWAEVKPWTVGRGTERSWAEWGTLTAFEVTPSGAIQPLEFHPDENIFVCDKLPGNIYMNRILGRRCYFQARPPEPFFQKGENPRSWEGTTDPYGIGYRVVDGNSNSIMEELAVGGSHIGAFYTVDTAVPVPANRFVFYPPQEGLDGLGNPFVEDYMRGYEVSTSSFEPGFLKDERMYHNLGHTLARVPLNYDSVVEVKFPLQKVRFMRLRNIVDHPYALAEMELYGEGFAPVATYVSEMIDLGKPMNFGKLTWELSRLRAVTEAAHAITQKGKLFPIVYKELEGESVPTISEDGTEVLLKIKDGVVVEKWKDGIREKTHIELLDLHQVVEVVPDPNVSVSIEVRTRSGGDDSPLIYHKINDMMEEVAIVGKDREEMEEKYGDLTPAPMYYWVKVRPEMRGSVTYDTEHWSSWSTPYDSSGKQIRSPGPRRYVQFWITLKSDSFWEFGRLESFSFECATALADSVLGEIAVEGASQPLEGIARVEAGRPTAFAYDVRVVFAPESEGGFDALRIAMPSQARFNGLEMGDPLEPVAHAGVDTSDSKSLTVYLPHEITRGRNDPIRVRFETAVLVHGTRFVGQVFDTEGEGLPQDIQAGDASGEVSTNRLQVLISEASLEEVLGTVEVSPNPMSPNGDEVNDRLTIRYILLQLTGEAKVEMGIYDLRGHKVWGKAWNRENGIYTEEWDGRGGDGRLVPPGVYLCKVRVETDGGVFEKTRSIATVY